RGSPRRRSSRSGLSRHDYKEGEFAEKGAGHVAGGWKFQQPQDPGAAGPVEEAEADVLQLARFIGEVAAVRFEDFGARAITRVGIDPAQLIDRPLARVRGFLFPRSQAQRSQ